MTNTRFDGFAACVVTVMMAACSSTPTPSGGGGGSRPAGATLPVNTPAATPSPGGIAASPLTGTDNPGSGTIPVATPVPSTAGDGLKEGQCAGKDVSTTRIVPTIWLVIDGSGSMVTMLGDTSRWVALRTALMDPTEGIVKTLEHDVQWGMIMYDGTLDIPVALPDGGVAMFSSPPATTCPRVVSVEPKKDNFDAINMVYPPDPLGGSTPTDKAMQLVIQHLPPSAAQAGPDVFVQPTIIVLATDGEPNNLCGAGGVFNMDDVKPAVIKAVSDLAAVGNKTYVISLAGDDQGLAAHLQQVAQAGGTGKPPFVPMNKTDLEQVFKDIIGAGAACDVAVAGKIKIGDECKGTISINGTALPCDDDNGWRLKDDHTVSITGTACDMYKADQNAQLHADFPCDVVTLN
jgi:hypothetical protein